VTGDTHINSTVGLNRYSVNLDDGGTYQASKGQRWLWRCWLDFWDSVGTTGDTTWTVLNGDLVDKPNGKFMGSQFISLNDADIFKMAIDVLEPVLDKSDRVFIIRGTSVHVEHLEEQIAIDIGAEKIDGNWSAHELLIDVEGVLFDIRHHGPLGRLPHTRGNALNRRAIEMILKYAGRRIPDVAIQSHNHKYSTSSDEYPVKVIALPAWQLTAEYAHKFKIIEAADIGGISFNCADGEYTHNVKRYTPEPTRVWKPSQPKT